MTLFEGQQMVVGVVPLATVLGSVTIAAIAAYWSYRSAKSSLLAYEAGLINDYYKTYASEDFLDHLRILSEWKAANEAGETRDFVTLLRSGDESAVKADRARRAVKSYFEGAANLGRAGYLRRHAVREVCNRAGINLYFDVAVPLTQEIDPRMDLTARNYLLRTRLRKYPEIQSVA